MPGNPTSIQATLLSVDQEYLKGGNSFDLKIEGGSIKGLVECIIRTWTEKQIRYIANNALNMHIYLMLPEMQDLTRNMDDIKDISLLQEMQYDRERMTTVFNKIDHPGTEQQFNDPRKWNDKVFMPQEILSTASDTLNNPFEIVAQYFNNIPLINFEEKRLSVEIPRMYQEDLARYDLYLRSWYERNKPVWDAWKEMDDVSVDVNAISEMEQAVANVYRNMQTLKEYRELPSKLYALIHTYDQYLIEVYYFVEKFMTELTGRVQTNAYRFSQWVDFVILLVGIVQTRQLLIDFSVNWHTKCAKCRQDNYDFYSCKLSLLCVELPILPIPDFHIPDIYIDLSDVQVGLDVILPRFNFVPRKLPMIRLPDLPPPDPIEIDIDIPTVPLLPHAPPLPELPTLDMDVDITLPTLPPAPKMPRLSPAIEVVIELADFIGSIFCIFK
jgi:hypothetical protein